jgi:LmbE family N-acetylglucosaminyl deacetylase
MMSVSALAIPSGPLIVFAIAAHPDDIEIGCGGTLLALKARGDVDIRTLVLTGTPERQIEATNAAVAFGASVTPTFAGLPDARLPEHWAATKDALTAFRDKNPQPDRVFATRRGDAHQDHDLIGSLVSTVWRGALLLHYEIPKWDGDLGQPNVYVPLRDEIASLKVRLLSESFPSQHGKGWWDDEFFLSIMRLRGAEIHNRYAEAFFSSKIALSLGAQ